MGAFLGLLGSMDRIDTGFSPFRDMETWLFSGPYISKITGFSGSCCKKPGSLQFPKVVVCLVVHTAVSPPAGSL